MLSLAAPRAKNSFTKNKDLPKEKQLKSLPIKSFSHIIPTMVAFTSVNLLAQTHVIYTGTLLTVVGDNNFDTGVGCLLR